MDANKKPRKKYKGSRTSENVKLRAQPLKVNLVFDPLYAILDQLESYGTIDETTSGQAVFRNLEGDWYDTVAALDGVISTYEIHETRTGRPLGLLPLRQLANKLQYSMPIFEADTIAARACLVRMKAETIEMTAGYARDLIQDFQIKEELLKEAA